jgi:16S rRNA (cytosine967-C5)-methyltransferase
MRPMPTPARTAAFDVLLRVERDRAFASELLHSDRLTHLSPQDRGLAHEIVLGVLRWQSVLDAAIAQHSSQPLRKLDTEVLIALRIAAYQLRFLDRVPSNAAVNESVELVKRAKKRSAVPFANAVLRKLTSTPPVAADPEQAHPTWMLGRWRNHYGAEAAKAICEYDQQVPAAAVRLPFDAQRCEQIERELASDGIELAPGALLRSARRVVTGDVTKTAAFLRGDIWIQDEASQLVALLAGGGRRILDCCAAPGGKTAMLAERNPASRIIALELHETRARLLRERVRAINVEIQTADLNAYTAPGPFDCVLADVPCSGTGTLARNPEIKWRLRPEDLADLHQRQVALLQSALRQLAPGGRLVYSTCSLEPEEGEAVVEEALTAAFQLRDASAELQSVAPEIALPNPATLLRGPYLRTIPGTHASDGFFAAVITRI